MKKEQGTSMFCYNITRQTITIPIIITITIIDISREKNQNHLCDVYRRTLSRENKLARKYSINQNIFPIEWQTRLGPSAGLCSLTWIE